jgi:hypothetical protein
MKLATRVLFVCFVTSIYSSTVLAGLFRAYISFNGNDGNPCTITAPCRLLPTALAAINDGGEIWMVDSANYNTGPVTINKSVKILAIPGALGSIIGNGGDAIIINAPNGNVTLRNLSVLNFGGGVNGITIQDAAGVHLEKLAIDGFTTDASSCVNFSVATTVRLYVDDSFLRECRNGIYANGSVSLANRPSVNVDNTRIERGINSTGTISTGVWMQGFVDVSLRNSSISRESNGIQFDNLLANNVSHLEIISSELTRNTAGIQFANTAASAVGQISIVGSQLVNNTDALLLSNTAVGGNTTLRIVDSHIAYTGNSGIQLTNSAPDVNTQIYAEVVRSEIANTTNLGVTLAAINGSRIKFYARDTSIANSTTLLKTSGASSYIGVTLIRSSLHDSGTAIDHGLGTIELDGTHINDNSNDLVNNGSGSIISIGNNFIYNNTDGSGFTYITPAIIAPK